MIKYNSNNINGWYFEDSDIIKVYRNNAVCYYKQVVAGGVTSQTPCYAVVNDISQYSDTEFEDVYNKADSKWYKLNNLNQYEEYGVYGSGRNITYYDGKLTIDDGYEYMYSGSSWVNVGEVSGSTATLPNVEFSVNYNAKNYDDSTHSIAKTSGQLVDVDAVISQGTVTAYEGTSGKYLHVTGNTKVTINNYNNYFNRTTNSAPNITIVSKHQTDGNGCHMFANRNSDYNWMYRPYNNKITLHGRSEQGGVAVTTQPVIASVRVDSERTVTYNNYTDNTTSANTSFNYGSTNSGSFFMFYGGYGREYFTGDFYWVYMSQNTLTDEQIQQVIAYNEGGGGQSIYPLYYDEKADPPNNLSFSSMTEAEQYECPWVGMKATIDEQRYVFSGDSTSGYEWVISSGLPDNYVIEFEDQNVKSLCVTNWGGNVVTGELTYGEAKQVTSLGTVFKNKTNITKFNELVYFTGLTELKNGEFAGCTNLLEIVIPVNVTVLDGESNANRVIFSGCTNLSAITFISDSTEMTIGFNACNNSYYMKSNHYSTPMVFPNRPLIFTTGTFGYYDNLQYAYFQYPTPPENLANSDINNYNKLKYVFCPVGSLSAYQTALAGKNKNISEYDFETDPNGLLDREKYWSAKVY